MPAITAVFYVCYIKAAMNNICGICWLVLLFFFPVRTSQPYVQLQMGGVLLAGCVCSTGSNCCASPLLLNTALLARSLGQLHSWCCASAGGACGRDGARGVFASPLGQVEGAAAAGKAPHGTHHPQTSPLSPPQPASPYK